MLWQNDCVVVRVAILTGRPLVAYEGDGLAEIGMTATLGSSLATDSSRARKWQVG